MKTLILDWTANNNGFATGIVIRNSGHSPEPVFMEWSRNVPGAGGVVNWSLPEISTWRTLPTLGGYVFPLPANTCGSLALTGSSAISLIDTTILSGGGGYGWPPVREAKTLAEAIPAFPSAHRSIWSSSPCWAFRPMNNLAHTRTLQMRIVQYAAMQVFHEFPERNDRALGVYDACHETIEDPAGHPAPSHGASHSLGLDVAYFTFGANHTQGAGATEIWAGAVPNSNFDIARNARFFSLVKLYLPDSVIMVDRRIGLAPGMPTGIFQLDDPELFYHHLHCHIALGERINWGTPI